MVWTNDRFEVALKKHAEYSASEGQANGPTTDLTPERVSSFLEELACAPERELSELFAGFTHGMVVANRFELLREIGRGGFGVIYEALDRELGRRVAFKVLRTGGRKGVVSDEALHQEAEAAAQLNHPNIVTLHDVGSDASGPYLVLELLRGETLQERMQRGLVPPREAIRIAIEVTKALAHAHSIGVLHRDLKPSNIFLTEDGQVKVLDFGLARFLGAGIMLRGGTPAYMAPEQWRGELEDGRTDLFALGVVLYEMLTGSLPFPVASGRSSALDLEPAPPLPLPKAPRKLVALVADALEQQLTGRPRNAQVFLERLIQLNRHVEKAPAHRRLIWISTAAVLVLGVSLALLFIPSGSEARVVISVADVVNNTGERDLDGISGLLITSLEQSRRLAVVTRSRMIDILRQLGRATADRIDESLAREVGQQVRARALLLTSLHRDDRRYALEIQAVDPIANEKLFTIRDEGHGKESIPAMIDRLSGQARRKLREHPADIDASAIKVGEAVTTNLEAYQHYFIGIDCWDRPSRYGRNTETCMEEFRKAVALDPQFAMAYYQLSRAVIPDITPGELERRAIAKALHYMDRVPNKDRLKIRAWAAHVDGKDQEAIALYRELVALFPEDRQALYLTGDVYWHLDDHRQAIPYLERVLKLDPTLEFPIDHLSYSLAILNRREELNHWLQVWSGMAPTPEVLHGLVRVQLGLRDHQAAIATARHLQKLGGTPTPPLELLWALNAAGEFATVESEFRPHLNDPRLMPGTILAVAVRGHRAEALRLLDAYGREQTGWQERLEYHLVRAFHLTGDQNAKGVWKEAQAILTYDPRKGSPAVLLAYLGDLRNAGELAATLQPGSANEEAYRALVDWKEGRPAQARARLEVLEDRNPFPRGGFPTAFLRGEVAAAVGLDTEAIEALQRYQRVPFHPFMHSWMLPRSIYLLARSYERIGDHDHARQEIDRLLSLWSKADPGLPLLSEARALRQRLDSNQVKRPGNTP